MFDVFDSESTLELNPEILTLTPGTSCISSPLLLEAFSWNLTLEIENTLGEREHLVKIGQKFLDPLR